MTPPTLLIYGTQALSSRMQYVCDWIFGEQLQLPWRYTSDAQAWRQHPGPKINYSDQVLLQDVPVQDRLFQNQAPVQGGTPVQSQASSQGQGSARRPLRAEDELRIRPAGLLTEGPVHAPAPAIQRWKRTTVLFYNQPGAAIPFDLFSAVFYLLSRYEEYLPQETDRHGRYKAENSLAGQYRFLEEPVVDQWLFHVRQQLEERFDFKLPARPFRLQFSFDVDMAWKYLHKGRRQWAGFVKELLTLKFGALQERIAVWRGRREDPYFSFPMLDQLHREAEVQPIFFFLLGRLGKFDRNNPPESEAMQHLIRDLTAQYPIGLHPSYQSHQDEAALSAEKAVLEKALLKPVTRSRQHYIKFRLPHTYRKLIRSGIEADYSMGYASHTGFRAGTSHSFLWYDLEAEKTTGLRVYPFSFMDATLRYYQGKTAVEARQVWEQLYRKIKAVDGQFISIWHNFILERKGEGYSAWLQTYADILKRLNQAET